VEAWERNVFTRTPPTDAPSATALIAREEAIRVWLAALGADQPWDIAPQLAEQDVSLADLEELKSLLGANEACVSLEYFARYLRARAPSTRWSTPPPASSTSSAPSRPTPTWTARPSSKSMSRPASMPPSKCFTRA